MSRQLQCTRPLALEGKGGVLSTELALEGKFELALQGKFEPAHHRLAFQSKWTSPAVPRCEVSKC